MLVTVVTFAQQSNMCTTTELTQNKLHNKGTKERVQCDSVTQGF